MKPALLLFLALAAVTPALGQSNEAASDTVQVFTEIELRDGSRFVGTIVSENELEIVLVTASGTEVRIAKNQVVLRREVAGRLRDGAFARFDPNATRMFFAPTGRSLNQGSGYLTAYYVFFGFAAYGVSDAFTVAGGTFWLPSLAGELVYFAPKATLYQKGSNAFSLGVLVGLAEGESAGVMYGVYTRGRPDAAVTAGLGFGFADGDVAADPVLVLGGEKSIARRTKIVAESYFLPTVGGGAVVLGGLRFFGDRIAADLGLLSGFGSEVDLPAIPWVGFAYNFGK